MDLLRFYSASDRGQIDQRSRLLILIASSSSLLVSTTRHFCKDLQFMNKSPVNTSSSLFLSSSTWQLFRINISMKIPSIRTFLFELSIIQKSSKKARVAAEFFLLFKISCSAMGKSERNRRHIARF